MAQPTTQHPLEVYACTFEDVKRFKQKHALAGTIALFACALIALIGYYFLTHNVMSVNLGPNLNIAASVGAGLSLLSVAIIGILIHYGCKISAKEAAASEEHFLEALTALPTTELLKRVKSNQDEWVWERFKAMLILHFPEENWQGMMRYFDKRFYLQTGCIYLPGTQNQIYDIFLSAEPTRFIFNYIELKVQNGLSTQCQNFLNNKLGDVYRHFTTAEWQQLVNAFDKKYGDYPYFTALRQQLLADLKNADENKFKEAGLVLDTKAMLLTIDAKDDPEETARERSSAEETTGSGTKGKHENKKTEKHADLLISD